ncbi:MAG: Gfo/Idh/MocA family oxidoreductase [Armatimonadetes bacterium]|nr:Gfo/Idh/MocA family oxidoreductase [Armatimonadota bacterium]
MDRRRFLATTTAGLGMGLAAESLTQDAPPLRLAVIGTGGRGTGLLRLALTFPEVQVPALCDIHEGRLNNAITLVREARGAAPEGYSRGPLDYRRLLERDDVDAVLVATPMQLHGRMSIDALRAGKHTLSEVAAAMTLDECWGLVRSERESGKTYMLAENCCYYGQNLAVRNMAEAGAFGELTYAECGYVHDCRALAFEGDGTLTWRGELGRDHNGNVYPTHSLGPVAQWLGINRGDRLESLATMATPTGSLHRYAAQRFGADSPQAKIDFALADSTSTLIRTARGAVIDLRFDMYSARPHPSTTYFTLQGLTGAYSDTGRQQEVWLEGRSPQYEWEPFAPYAGEFQHDLWKRHGAQASQSGHGGADFFAIQQFLEAVREGKPSPIPAADAAAWSSIIPLSAASIRAGGAPQAIPDFTEGRWRAAAG